MPYADLRDFIAQLERAGELKRIKTPVDPNLEVTEIVQRVVRAGGPGLLFEQPTAGEMPLAINLFGTTRSATASATWSRHSSRSAGAA